jgi:hypothetical protein
MSTLQFKKTPLPDRERSFSSLRGETENAERVESDYNTLFFPYT